MYVEKVTTKSGTAFKFVECYIDPLTGKNRRVCVTLEKNTAQTRKVAQQTLAEKIKRKSEFILETKEMTVGQLIDLYKESQKTELVKATIIRNGYAMQYWERLLGRDTLVSKLPILNVLGMMERIGEEPGTMNERLTRFKAMIRWGYANGHIESAEFLNRLRPFRTAPHKVRIADKYLEPEEYKILLPELAIDKWRLLVEFLVLSGLRFGEAAALNVSDVDIDGQVIHVTKTWDVVNGEETHAKSWSSNRDVHMQPQLLEVCRRIHVFMLRRRLLSKTARPLFLVDDDGGHISYFAFNKYLKENTAKYCGKQITVHALRHTAASIMFTRGFTEEEVARRLGHASSRITKDIYIHVTKELQERDNRKLDAYVV